MGDIVVVIKVTVLTAQTTIGLVLIVWNSELQVCYECVKIRTYIIRVTH